MVDIALYITKTFGFALYSFLVRSYSTNSGGCVLCVSLFFCFVLLAQTFIELNNNKFDEGIIAHVCA